jgi:diaminopimelate decarboxylase
MKILHFDENNQLTFENTAISEICKEIETPFYLYSENDILQNCQSIINHGKITGLTPCYALKANYNPSILKIIKDSGFGADVVSGGELYFALKAGFAPDKIVFAGVGKTEEEIEYAINSNIHSVNIESESELNLIDAVTKRLKKNIKIAIRINPDIDPQTHPYISTGLHFNKFGVAKNTALKLFEKSKDMPYIAAEGLHVHIGSQITSVTPYIDTVKILKDFVNQLHGIGIDLKFLDLGGGIGINYENQLSETNNPRTYIDDILPKVLQELESIGLKLYIELGRSVIGSAGLLITKVIHVKETEKKKFIITDAAMNNLIRPSLYQAHHQILPIVNNGTGEKELVDIVGPVCETSDFLAKDRELQILSQGDFIAVTGAGAYGQALASNYNLRPVIAEILVNKVKYKIIRQRETMDELAERFDWN